MVPPPYQPNPYSPLMSMFASYSVISENTLLAKLHTYKNLILWISGHVHRNAITPQPSPDGDPEKGFWEVETPSLRDLPQQFPSLRDRPKQRQYYLDPHGGCRHSGQRRIPFQTGRHHQLRHPRKYGIATMEIFNNQVQQGPSVDPKSGVYNAELVKQLSPEMQAKISRIPPAAAHSN